jgi:ATP-binding cassette subfamily F protein uup
VEVDFMALLSLRDICMNFGKAEILDGVSLQIESGERVCLIGRNGEGKSTLMSIMNGDLEPISGQIIRQPGLKIAMLDQKVPSGIYGTVYEEVSRGFGPRGSLLKEYHQVSRLVAEQGQPELLARLDRIHRRIETEDAWHVHQIVDTVISHLKLDPDADVSTLSAGLKRRVLLARALALEPDILMLDEPTNHLDVDSIVWLEQFLETYPATIVFVTHDRMFLRKLSTRILDIDRGRLTSWQCNYDDYVVRKQALLDAEAVQNRQFDKKLAQEEAWIRTGIQARRTRNEGRVRALLKLREQYRKRRTVVGKVKMQAQAAPLSGDRVIDANGISFAYTRDGQRIIDNFTATLMRGDKIGIIGPNGSGKTTLLKVLLGELKTTDGTIRLGTNLEIAYFDQLHARLDNNKAVWENVADGYSSITINGQGRHVVGYLQDFLFTPQQARSLVSSLSGGERNRLLLARLFAKPSNVLVLDEPTNDLDMETLELLEELLIDYTGTVLLVSHDRAFLNNVVTGTVALEGHGKVKEYAGGYDDWLRQRPVAVPPVEETSLPKPAKEKSPHPAEPGAKKKLTYKEQRELESLTQQIEAMEQQQARLHEQMADPAFYKQPADKIAATAAQAQQIDQQLKSAYTRWEQLEG